MLFCGPAAAVVSGLVSAFGSAGIAAWLAVDVLPARAKYFCAPPHHSIFSEASVPLPDPFLGWQIFFFSNAQLGCSHFCVWIDRAAWFAAVHVLATHPKTISVRCRHSISNCFWEPRPVFWLIVGYVVLTHVRE